jgi:glutamine synthetase
MIGATMSVRSEAIQKIGKRPAREQRGEPKRQSQQFGARVFGREQIEQSLPKKASSNWLAAMDGQERIEKEYLDLYADALKEWAMRLGATHYTHWFQPLAGGGAEKHDSFLSWKGSHGGMIERLRGQELLQGETDASSFPSGGLRSTSAARGYTIWDPSTPPFLWEDRDGLTLCIPALFISWKGDALDYKIPLLRAEEKLAEAAKRLLKMANIPAKSVFSTLGPEQEYFAVDRHLYHLRPDLMLAGRTVYGARPPKAQEQEDHYFAAIHPRVLAYMRDFEEAALLLAIPVKTRHNEVAPAQHEMAPLFEKCAPASDHNLLLMELMRQKAVQHDLACLFHEKPFARINGSGKHCNWSLATDTGLNFLEPKADSFVFIVMLTAVLRAVHEHASLIRSSIGSATNDCRLGGSEAPPTILSVYLGDALESLVRKIIHNHEPSPPSQRMIDLGLSSIPLIEPAASDRNRTSFFAFTGNKFEFRAVGASQHVAWPMAIINAIVADSLELILDEIEDMRASIGETRLQAALPVLRKHLREAEPVLFSGDNYSREWEQEAGRRGLSNIRRSFHSFAILRDPKTQRVFKDVLSADELASRLEVFYEQYAKQMNIECNLMIELFRTQILPAALEHQKEWAKSIIRIRDLKISEDIQLKPLYRFSELINEAIEAVDELEEIKKVENLGWEALAKVFCELALPRMEKARQAVDRLEALVDDKIWPLPKYREMLFFR